MRSLLDINVWLALTFSGHPHHRAALTWFDEKEDGSCLFCRMTQQGYLRLATNPKVFAADALDLPGAWGCYDTLMSDLRVGYTEEIPGLEGQWRKLTGQASFSAKIWNDAFLASLAICGDLEMVSFDRGFRRYDGLRLTVLGE